MLEVLDPSQTQEIETAELIALSSSAGSELCFHCGFSLRPSRKKEDGPRFCCYGCAFAHQVLAGSPDGNQISWVLVKLGIAAFLAMSVMGFSLALHASSVYPDFYARLTESGKVYDELLRYLLLFLSAPVFFLVGVPLIENVVSEVKAGRWGVDGFITGSVLAAFTYSLVSTLRGSGPVYYDIAVMVLVFLTLGRYLEARFRLKASRSLERLLEEETITASRIENGSEHFVAAEELVPGDEILLRAGQRVPADGEILEGAAVLEMAPMTGEPIPVDKKPGECVWSGAMVSEGFLKVRLTHLSRESWTARLRKTLEQARASKSSVERLADKIVLIMSVVTVVLAAAAFFLGWERGGLMPGLLRALSVLVIVCPCALGAAIPLSLWRSFESVAGRGILFKDLGLLETLSKVRGVFFDKTGTLTESLPRLACIENLSPYTDEELLRLAASLSRVSVHPFSKAVLADAETRKISLALPMNVRTSVGEGISGSVEPYGRLMIGSREYLERENVLVKDPEVLLKSAGEFGSFLFAVDGRLAARFHFEEKIREEAFDVIRQFKKRGFQVGILTGDRGAAAEEIGRQLGLEVVSGLTPEGKLKWIRERETALGPLLVVGEGLNDAPMLAGASVSLAMGGALARTRDVADFSLPDNDLSKVFWLTQTARHTFSKIRKNLFWAFFYNGLAVPLAVMGRVNPIIAALAMIVSSAFIILYSLQNER